MDSMSEWKEYPAVMNMYECMRDDIMKVADYSKVTEASKDMLELGIEEMLGNIIKYAYDEPGYIRIRTGREENFFRVDIADNGRPFNPLEKDTRGAYHDEDDPDEGGLGIFLVKKYFDKIEYSYEDFQGKKANILSLWLKIK